MTRLRVPDSAAGERLDRFLAALPEIGSRAVAERLVREERRTHRRPRPPKSARLAGGEELEFDAPAPVTSTLAPEPMDLAVPYEDEHLLVVDKPAGVVVHPAPGHAQGTLVHGLLAYDVEGGDEADRPGIVHRLDRDTSGLLVVAERRRRTGASRSSSTRARSRASTSRSSSAGRGRGAGTIEAPIGRDRRDPLRH